MAKNKTPAKKPVQKPEDADHDDDRDGEGGEGDDGGDDDGELDRRINAIVTSRIKREMKGVNTALAGIAEKLNAMTAPKKSEETEDDPEGDDEGKKEPKIDPKLSRKMTKLERELAEEREARKKAEQAQKEEQERAKRQEMIGVFDSALTEHGVTDPKLRRAALKLLEEDGYMVREEETGKIKFKGQDKYGFEAMFDPKAGVKTWVLNEGKSFVPAIDTGGSGTGAAKIGVGNTKLTRGEFSKLTPQAKAAIELERASQGLPPLGED